MVPRHDGTYGTLAVGTLLGTNMSQILISLLWVAGGTLFFFAAYQILLMLISAIYWMLPKKPLLSGRTTKFGVIIPAHNEEILIGGLVKSIQEADYPHDLVHIYVIADNCDEEDKTIEIAGSLGADVRVRNDTVKRGKPYALNWLISSIDLDQHDAYVIIDADTTVDRSFFKHMEDGLMQGHDVIQGYFGVMNPDENWLTRLSILPGIVKFLLHFPGKKMLNLSCPLAGNGMCFRNTVFKKYGWNAYSIAENWEYYVQLTLEGHRVSSAENAVIYSQVAKSLKTGTDQRQRWQRGRIDTLAKYWKQLLGKAVFKLDFALLDTLIEVMRPSHAMLMFGSVMYLLLSTLLYLFIPEIYPILVFSLVIVLMQVVYFLSGLIIQKAPLSTWLSLFMVPPYLIWKAIISFYGLKGRKNKSWIKTERH